MLSPATALVALTAVGLAARLYELGARGFWFDEIAFAYSARSSTLAQLLAYVGDWGDHTPLSFFLIWLFRGLGGEEAIIRLPFAIAGALGIPAIYLLGQALSRPRVGLLAALLYALSPFAVFHSQDAHPYAPLMLFTTLQMLFAYRAATSSRPLDWAGLALFTLLNFYNDYLALAVTAVATTFLGITLISRLAIPRKKPQPPGQDSPAPATDQALPTLRFQVLAALATAAAIALLFLPWLSSTLSFLKMPVRTFYASRPGAANFDDALTLTRNLGIDLLLAILLLIGLLYIVLSLIRERKLSSLLLFIWLAGPLAGFWLLTGSRMFLLQPRYYSFLLPAAFITIALGANWIATLATPVLSRLANRSTTTSPPDNVTQPRYLSGVTFTAIVIILLVVAVPTLIGSYSRSKVVPQDYRGAVTRIIDESAPGSIVVSVGMWGLKPAPPPSVFAIQGIEYYLWLYRSSIPYLDASLLDEATVARLANGSEDATVWGAWGLPWPINSQALQHAADMGLEVIPFDGLALIRQRAPRASLTQQLDTLLAWGIEVQPGLMAIQSLLNPGYKASALGENILPPFSASSKEERPDTWFLRANSSLATDASSIALTSPVPQGQTNVTISTGKLTPGATYVLLVSYHNTQLTGDQRVYLSTYAESELLIETFPHGTGFLLPPGSDSASAFAFKVPSTATDALLWLRIDGEGTAEFTSVEIRPLLPTP